MERVPGSTMTEERPSGGGERLTMESWVGLQNVTPRSSNSCHRVSDGLVERGVAKSLRDEAKGSSRAQWGEIRSGFRGLASWEITKAAGDNPQSERGLATVSHRNGRGPGGKERDLGTSLSEERPPGGGGGRAMECWLGLQSGIPRRLDSHHKALDGLVERGAAKSWLDEAKRFGRTQLGVVRSGSRRRTDGVIIKAAGDNHQGERGLSTAKRKQPGLEDWVTRKAASAREWLVRKGLEIDGLAGAKRLTREDGQDGQLKRLRDSGGWEPAAEAEPPD